jgi:hypothetical protein
MKLFLLEERYCVCLLDPAEPIPDWVQGPGIRSSTYTASELSIVCPQRQVPMDIQHESDWRALQVEGPLAFEQVGILHSLLEPLAKALIPVFVVSTYLTDYLFIRTSYLVQASQTLMEAGHQIQSDN